jgi:DNA-directed RNA polymerase specialized sigma24 family protein
VVRGGGGGTRPRTGAAPARTAILGSLGVDAATYAALAVLAPRERASIVAAVVERLDRRDVATIVGRDGPALDRLLVRARLRYMAAHAAAAGDVAPHGPFVDRLAAEAARAMR